MSIIHSFDISSEEILQARDNIQCISNFPETIIVTFSSKFSRLFVNQYSSKEITNLKAGGNSIPIYLIEYKGKNLGFYHSVIGGAASSALLEETIALGGKKILYFGSCGVLDKTISEGNILVPTHAYRDEGVSYHYAPPSDYLNIETSDHLIQILTELHVPFIKTKTWTTDAFYRETKNNLNKRKQEGCSVVEMECASIMSVGQFRKQKVYQFLYASDCLDAQTWDKRILGAMPLSMRERILQLSLEIGIRL